MNNFNSSKYIFSPQRRDHGGPGNGTYIVLPNRAHNDNMLSSMVRPLAMLLNRVYPSQA